MDVTLPNGKVIKGVPEGTPKDVIRQKAIQAGLAKAEDFPEERTFDEVSRTAARREAMSDVASELGPFEAGLVGMGRGFATVGRGLGLMDPETQGEREAMEVLKEQRPYSTGAGEITGEVLPFLPAGMGIGSIPSLVGRVGAGGALGATEAGVLAAGQGKDVVPATGIGAGIGAGAELLFPVLGRLGRSVYQRVTGTPPRGSLFTPEGRPTPEMQQALDQAGITMDDLVVDAQQMLRSLPAGADPEQAARAARFQQQGIPATRGEVTGSFEQQATEQRLLESAADQTADPFRQFKLQQSNAIRENLERSLNTGQIPEETGEQIVEALTGRKNLLRTKKNELYQQAAEAAEEAGGIPLFTDELREAVPDSVTLRRLNRISKGRANDAYEIMAEYGVVNPTDEMIEAGVKPEPLTVQNFDEFRQSLLQIERDDTSGAVSRLVRPVVDALDTEADSLVDRLSEAGVKSEVIQPLKEARKTVRQYKTEFNPKALVGQLTDVKKGSVEPVVAASKVYSKLATKAQPVENVRKLVTSLKAAGPEGQQALNSLRATTMLDLIEAGFGTESRKINGVKVFNPIAFKNRIKSLGKDKLAAIFKGEPELLKRINNIENIASDLIPPSGAMPKGSASVILDLMNRLGVIGITSKMPGGELFVEGIRRLSEGAQSRRSVQEAMEASPEVEKIVNMFDQTFPGIATALSVPMVISDNQEDNQ